jgi:hypothetical protein
MLPAAPTIATRALAGFGLFLWASVFMWQRLARRWVDICSNGFLAYRLPPGRMKYKENWQAFHSKFRKSPA